MRQRIQTTDLVKGIAVILMIQVHLLEVFAAPAMQASAAGKTALFLGGPFVAPVFMVLLGYFIMLTGKSPGQIVLRGLGLFLLGMVLNILMNLNLIISVNRGLLRVDLLPYIFGVDILHVAGLSCICIGALKRVLESNVAAAALAALAAAGGAHFISGYIPQAPPYNYPASFFFGCSAWSYFPLFPWLAYPLTGVSFYLIRQKSGTGPLLKNKIFVWLALAVPVALGAGYAFSVSTCLPAYYHHGFLFFGWTIFFLGLYFLTADIMQQIFKNFFIFRFLRWMGKNVTLMYMIQWIIIGNIGTGIYQSISSGFSLLFYFLAVLAASALLTLIILKVKAVVQEA